ncbi:MAG TPA: polysaccharide deacetylase family protein [Bacillota bacterium]|nr:polysaccharide deacetylase family protein [Bacillota bacterium]
MRKILFFLCSFILAFFPTQTQAAGKVTPVFHIDTHQKIIALTFDDGPHPIYTPLLLELLHKERVRATFFLLGNHAEKYPKITSWIYHAGHEIGNHSYSHREMKNLTRAEIYDEIKKTERIIHKIVGRRPDHFRSPYGEISPSILKATYESGYQLINWSIDPRDWDRHRTAEVMTGSIQNKIRPGDIVLFHDGGGNQKEMLEAVKNLIHTLKLNGYHFVTISELMELE